MGGGQLSFIRKAYPVAHAGVTTDGQIVVTRGNGDAKFIDDGASADELKARGERAVALGTAGGPWVPAPGILEHQVIGELASGKKITGVMAGWVWNDAGLIDDLCGAGTYERVMPPEEIQILQLARPLYGLDKPVVSL